MIMLVVVMANLSIRSPFLCCRICGRSVAIVAACRCRISAGISFSLMKTVACKFHNPNRMGNVRIIIKTNEIVRWNAGKLAYRVPVDRDAELALNIFFSVGNKLVYL